MALTLTPALREKLKTPYGKLYKGKGDECLRSIVDTLKATKVISIGDVTTYYLLKAGIVPDICLVDDKTMRLPVEHEVRKGTAHASFKEVSVKNPAGVVTDDLINALKDNMDSKKPVRIFVEGEEDLAVIPACMYAPIGSIVIYGQPSEGVVVVKITEKKRLETISLVEQMKKEAGN